MPLSGLVFRLVQGSPLSAATGDSNLRKIRDFVNALEQLFGVVLKTNGTLKDGAVGSSAVIADGVVTSAKLADDAKIPPGTIVQFAGGSAPSGWAICDGAAVSRATNATLFTNIGTAWGAGDGLTTFNLPDLRGYALVGTGGVAAGITNRAIGTKFGVEEHLLTAAQSGSPAHAHEAWDGAVKWDFAGSSGSAGSYAKIQPADVTLTTKNSAAVAAASAHPNMQPSAYVTHIIKL